MLNKIALVLDFTIDLHLQKYRNDSQVVQSALRLDANKISRARAKFDAMRLQHVKYEVTQCECCQWREAVFNFVSSRFESDIDYMRAIVTR